MTELNLDEATTEFGDVYKHVKGFKSAGAKKKSDGWEQLLKDAQLSFFDAVTKYWETQTLARKTVEYPDEVSEDSLFEEWVKTYHPGWRVVSVDDDEPRVLLEEDPKLKKFAYVNKKDKTVYARTVTEGGPSLDVDRLLEEDPETFMAITFWPKSVYNLAFEALAYAYTTVHNRNPEGIAGEYVNQFLEEKVGVSNREVLPPNDWTKEQASKLTDYWIPGTLAPRLTPPRAATKEELETGEVEA